MICCTEGCGHHSCVRVIHSRFILCYSKLWMGLHSLFVLESNLIVEHREYRPVLY